MKSGLAGLFAATIMASTAPAPAQSYNVTDLGAVSGQKVSKAYGLNGLGQAAGSSSNPSGAIATLFSNGKAINLGTLEPLDVAIATALNGAGQVVGYEPFKPGKHVGFIVHNGSPVDLNKLISSNSGFIITDAVGINDSGEILCDATNASGYEHAVLLTPK